MEVSTLSLRVVCPDLDAEDLTELMDNLREAVLAAEVADARPGTAGRGPAGAKSGEMVEVGALIVALAPAAIEGLVAVVSAWLRRQSSDVEIELDGHRFRGAVTQAQRDELVAAWLRRVGTAP